MGVASAVQWWENSQLRVLVLGSLVVQYILLIASTMRRNSVRFWWVRPVTWLAYLGSDAIAIYGLATLFNHYKKRDGGHGYSAVEVLWAPILLIHLGGQDSITAYNIEDNELWMRHILTAMSQVTVAIYVFWKSWPRSDRRLLQAAILLFVPGILKCIEKPWALYRASISSLDSSEESVRRTTNKDAKIDQLKDFVTRAAGSFADEAGAKASDEDLELQPEAGAKASDVDLQVQPEVGAKASDEDLELEPEKLFVDLASPSSEKRLKALHYFCALDANKACWRLREGLHHTFDLLYTKQKMLADFLPGVLRVKLGEGASQLWILRFCLFFSGLLLRGVLGYLLFAAIPLFHHSQRKAYTDQDVKVTYAMICGTAGLEYFAFVANYNMSLDTSSLFKQESQRRSTVGEMSAKSRPGLQFLVLGTLHRIRRLREKKRQRRSIVEEMQRDDLVFQYNLLGLFARNQKYPNMMSIVGAIGCQNILRQRWCMKSSSLSRRITPLVLEYVRCGWKEGHMHDVPSYKKFNDNRGQFTLRHQECYDKLGWTLQGSFDESVLLWHLVTDFCYHYTGPSRHGSRCTKGHAYGYRCPAWCEASSHHDTAVLCTHMSNYMAYLLFVKPDMLMAGTRRAIFTHAYKELKGIVVKAKKPVLKERELVQMIIIELDGRVPAAPNPKGSGETFVDDAWDIAKVLMALSDEAKMWKVIQGVWVEMLCFSATRCRGYLHAKSLGTGVEYLSYVWLLMYYMGMETLADRLQRVDDHGGEPTRSDYSCREHEAAHPENSTDTGEDITTAG